MRLKFTMTFLPCLAFSACASLPDAIKTVSKPQVSPASASLDRLPAQDLVAGECGIFVWSADEKKRFILFSRSNSKSALFNTGEQTLELTRVPIATSNSILKTAKHIFESTGAGRIELDLAQAEPLIGGGTRYKAGILSFKPDTGWDRVIPVVGLFSCQPK